MYINILDVEDAMKQPSYYCWLSRLLRTLINIILRCYLNNIAVMSVIILGKHTILSIQASTYRNHVGSNPVEGSTKSFVSSQI
jgi:hypothetical protein